VGDPAPHAPPAPRPVGALVASRVGVLVVSHVGVLVAGGADLVARVVLALRGMLVRLTALGMAMRPGDSALLGHLISRLPVRDAGGPAAWTASRPLPLLCAYERTHAPIRCA